MNLTVNKKLLRLLQWPQHLQPVYLDLKQLIWLQPATDAPKCKKQTSGIKRPMNAFMAWSQMKRHEIAEAEPDKRVNHRHVSKTLGKTWKNLSFEEKEPWILEADRLRKLHATEYPDYKYRPRMRNRQKGRNHNVRQCDKFPVKSCKKKTPPATSSLQTVENSDADVTIVYAEDMDKNSPVSPPLHDDMTPHHDDTNAISVNVDLDSICQLDLLPKCAIKMDNPDSLEYVMSGESVVNSTTDENKELDSVIMANLTEEVNAFLAREEVVERDVKWITLQNFTFNSDDPLREM